MFLLTLIKTKKTMKTLLFSLFLLIFNIPCSAQWVELNVGDVNAMFTDVYAITPDIVVVIGSNGTILKTTDGGTTWQQKTSGSNQYLQKIRFSNSNIGYIIGGQGTLLKTTDGGETWTSINTGYSEYFASLSPVGDNVVYIAYDEHLLKSYDGGISWQNYPLDFYSGDVQFLTPEIGYSSKSNGGMLKTENGGETWHDVAGSSSFHFIDNMTGFCYMEGLKKTNNGGDNFIQLGYGSKSIRKMFAINDNAVWGVLWPSMNGVGAGIVKMSYNPENGYTESYEYDSNTEMKLSFYFSNDKLGYAVGIKNEKGTIWKNTTGNTAGTSDEIIKSIKVFPNPTSDKINVQIDNQFTKEFSINLTDMSGKLVFDKTYRNQKDVFIDVKNLTKGTYLVNIKGQNQSYSQKIIVK